MIFIKGSNIDLHLVDDVKKLKVVVPYINNQELVQYMQRGETPILHQDIIDYHDDIISSGGLYLFVCNKNSDILGTITLYKLSYTFRNAEIGIMLWEIGKGYGTEAIKLITWHAFNKMNIHRLSAGVVDINISSNRAFQKSGFTQEGRQADAYFCLGKYRDIILYSKINKK